MNIKSDKMVEKHVVDVTVRYPGGDTMEFSYFADESPTLSYSPLPTILAYTRESEHDHMFEFRPNRDGLPPTGMLVSTRQAYSITFHHRMHPYPVEDPLETFLAGSNVPSDRQGPTVSTRSSDRETPLQVGTRRLDPQS